MSEFVFFVAVGIVVVLVAAAAVIDQLEKRRRSSSSPSRDWADDLKVWSPPATPPINTWLRDVNRDDF